MFIKVGIAMRLSSIKYYFKEGFSGLFRNQLMTIASIATVASCILIITFSYCIVSNLQYILAQMQDSIGISVFVEEDLSAEEVTEINEQIKNIEHVSRVNYITPQEALDKLKEQLGMESVLDGFDGENNPLSDSFEVYLDNIKNQNTVLDELQQINGVRKIRHAQTETEILMKASNAIRIIGGVVIIVLMAISIVIIMNTIKISVYTRKNEIMIMKFVGATDWFIRWPFIIQGVLIGFIGAAIPIVISWPVYSKIINLIYDNSPIIKNLVSFKYSIDIFSVLIPLSLGAGMLIGVLGSVTSIHKYLKA